MVRSIENVLTALGHLGLWAGYPPTARAVLAAVPALLREAEAAGAVTVARYLGQALGEAEGIVRQAP